MGMSVYIYFLIKIKIGRSTEQHVFFRMLVFILTVIAENEKIFIEASTSTKFLIFIFCLSNFIDPSVSPLLASGPFRKKKTK